MVPVGTERILIICGCVHSAVKPMQHRLHHLEGQPHLQALGLVRRHCHGNAKTRQIQHTEIIVSVADCEDFLRVYAKLCADALYGKVFVYALCDHIKPQRTAAGDMDFRQSLQMPAHGKQGLRICLINQYL